MERLTARDGDSTYYVKCFSEPCLGTECKVKKCNMDDQIRERLALYEDSGIDAEHLSEVNKAFLDKCREVNELKEEMIKLRNNSVSHEAFMNLITLTWHTESPKESGDYIVFIKGAEVSTILHYCWMCDTWEEDNILYPVEMWSEIPRREIKR